MLSNITITNKTTIDPNNVKTPLADIELSDGTKFTPYNYNIPSSNPIRFGKLNGRDNPVATENTLIINIDGKDYIASELSAVFNPGRAPVTFDIKDLVEVDVSTPLYDVTLNHVDDNVLEIQGGSNDFSKFISWSKDRTSEEQKQLELEYKEKNKDWGLQGFDIEGVVVNNSNICFSSLELFTENNRLQARGVFAVSSIKFTGEDINTNATYYKEKEQNLVKYVFKPGPNLTTDYTDLVFYIDPSVETEEKINKKIEEAISNNWKLYSINGLVVDS